MNKKWLNNQTIIISGASSGIGKELARLFITCNNCHVIGIGRNQAKMEAFKAQLGDKADKFEYRLFDVSDKKAWESFAQSINEQVALVINNAGMFYKFDNFLNIDDATGKQIMDTNFYSITYSCYSLLPKLMQKGGIVNISSSDALLAVGGTSYYAASKGAIKSFTQSLAAEFPKLYVGCVFPGFTDTDIFRDVNFTAKETRLLKKFISPCGKISKKIYKNIIRRKTHVVVGYDAKLFNMFSKRNPIKKAKFVTNFLHNTKLEMFSSVQK